MRLRLKPVPEQVIVITGASSGIGLSTARAAAGRGARVVVAGRSRGALERLAAELDGRALAVVADVTSERDVRRIAAEAIRVFGGFDTWINNAAVSAYGPCLDVPLADMRRIMETNFWGMVYGARTACAHLQHAGGCLINVASVVADRAVPLQGIYSASKHAMKGWTDALRTELLYERAPIAVALIKPAPINTPYAEHARNYLADQPVHVPPVYAPRAVADAILYAAEHPVRELTVGGSGRLLSLVNTLAPRVVDRLMARLVIPATHSGAPRYGRPALYEPSEDLRERGDYPGVTRRSAYTALATHPAMLRLAAAGAAAGAAAALSAWAAHRDRSGRVTGAGPPAVHG
jgi:short-subunit dehydrogenase